VSVIGDNVSEYAEYFLVNLTNGSVGTEIQDGQATGMIFDDDVVPVISVAVPKPVLEGAPRATATVPFVVSLSAVSQRVVFVNYATADGTASTAGALVSGGLDYVASSASLTFAPGETAKTVNVTVNGDATWESNETFTLALSGAGNGTISTTAGSATATITNDDAVPVVSVNNCALTEGTPPPGGVLQTPCAFTVSLTNPTSVTASVRVQTRTGPTQGTANPGPGFSPTNPIDYVRVPLTTLTFTPGQTSQALSVLIIGDAIVEANEGYFVDLSMPMGATLSPTAATGNGTIRNDD